MWMSPEGQSRGRATNVPGMEGWMVSSSWSGETGETRVQA